MGIFTTMIQNVSQERLPLAGLAVQTCERRLSGCHVTSVSNQLPLAAPTSENQLVAITKHHDRTKGSGNFNSAQSPTPRATGPRYDWVKHGSKLHPNVSQEPSTGWVTRPRSGAATLQADMAPSRGRPDDRLSPVSTLDEYSRNDACVEFLLVRNVSNQLRSAAPCPPTGP